MATTNSAGVIKAAEHLEKAAEQLRRFSEFGLSAYSEPAAQHVERLAEALRVQSQ
jgi:hypothetical protein